MYTEGKTSNKRKLSHYISKYMIITKKKFTALQLALEQNVEFNCVIWNDATCTTLLMHNTLGKKSYCKKNLGNGMIKLR